PYTTLFRSHPNYEVSSLGRVRSLPHVDRRGRPWPGKLLKPGRTGKGKGYLTVQIERKNRKVHRLVAEAFLPADPLRPCVNHKNGNPHDNRVENLEWCTNQENAEHAWAHLGRRARYAELRAKGLRRPGGHPGKHGSAHHSSIPIVAFSPCGEIKRYESASDAARSLGLRSDAVIRTANGQYRHTGG